ncbi:unnamed protein product [Amoebophrya sp. A25]|nr:unnamed protein product [Amoebophrya sp. A25]|eukprot:GSA25T00011752001.1
MSMRPPSLPPAGKVRSASGDAIMSAVPPLTAAEIHSASPHPASLVSLPPSRSSTSTYPGGVMAGTSTTYSGSVIASSGGITGSSSATADGGEILHYQAGSGGAVSNSVSGGSSSSSSSGYYGQGATAQQQITTFSTSSSSSINNVNTFNGGGGAGTCFMRSATTSNTSREPGRPSVDLGPRHSGTGTSGTVQSNAASRTTVANATTGQPPGARFGPRSHQGSVVAKRFHEILARYSATFAGQNGPEAVKFRKVTEFALTLIKNAEKHWKELNKEPVVREFEGREKEKEKLRQVQGQSEVTMAQLKHLRMVKPEAHNTALKANLTRDLHTIQDIVAQVGDTTGSKQLEEFQARVASGVQGVEEDMRTLKRRKVDLVEKEKDLRRIETQILSQPGGGQLERLLWGAKEEHTAAFVQPAGVADHHAAQGG